MPHLLQYVQVLHGKPQELLPKVWSDWGITKLCFEVDTEPYAKERDSAIQNLAEKQGTPLLPLSPEDAHQGQCLGLVHLVSGHHRIEKSYADLADPNHSTPRYSKRYASS